MQPVSHTWCSGQKDLSVDGVDLLAGGGAGAVAHGDDVLRGLLGVGLLGEDDNTAVLGSLNTNGLLQHIRRFIRG